MENFNATRYKLQNVATKRIFEDEGWTLDDTQSSHPSLIRAVYESQQIHPHGEEHGIYRFAEWLPVKRMLAGSCAPVTYKSKGLAQKLGLKNLYITFNGYFPEIGARMSTCSFKETAATRTKCWWWLRPAIRRALLPKSVPITVFRCC